MKVFNPQYFLRHISPVALREYAAVHVLFPRITIDPSTPDDAFITRLTDTIEALDQSLKVSELPPEELKATRTDLNLWHDDLRRAHLMSSGLAIKEFRTLCPGDEALEKIFALRDDKEKALWMMAFRDKAFRDAELHIAFHAKSNGKYWKKHRIQAGLDPTRDRAKLENFGNEVAKLYKKSGCGESTHIELTDRSGDGSIQLTIYVEGPVTAIAHFTNNNFNRITTRIALETALVYQPDTGFVETVVKGGNQFHTAVLSLFGQHVVEQTISPEEIERKRYDLNALRDGMMEPFDDWSKYGVEKVRLRRARFTPRPQVGTSVQVEASTEKDKEDAIHVALSRLAYENAFDAEYDVDGASIIVYTLGSDERKAGHFSFDVFSTGSSTIKNLSEHNQPIANVVLQALNVIEPETV